MLTELLGERFDDLWRTVLYGGSDPGGDLVAVALSQVGNVGGEPYWSWYGFSTRVEWCACFVSWCAEQCGYLDAGVIPKFSGCIQGSNWFKERGQWQDRTYEPQPGDIIFFDWATDGGPDGLCDHVGIVERVEAGRVYTVEGNSGDMCCNNSYPLGYEEIYGYGTIDVKQNCFSIKMRKHELTCRQKDIIMATLCGEFVPWSRQFICTILSLNKTRAAFLCPNFWMIRCPAVLRGAPCLLF